MAWCASSLHSVTGWLGSFKVPGRENSFNKVEINWYISIWKVIKALVWAVQASRVETGAVLPVQFLRGYRRHPSRPVRLEGLQTADITPKTKALKCPACERRSLDAKQTPTIFLPFPEKSVLEESTKKAKTNLFWGNFVPFTCQAELLGGSGPDSRQQLASADAHEITLGRGRRRQSEYNHSPWAGAVQDKIIFM